MSTQGKPPRIPVSSTYSSKVISSTLKSPTSVTTTQRNVELEALKQRGLAKILNKHFTETTNRLAQEKAAADAAVADLQSRKAQTSEFHASSNGELSPLDAMCLRANQWRQECRRKERETLLLYQRYVHKFGETGAVSLRPAHQHQWVPPAKPDDAKTSAPSSPRSPARSTPITIQGTQVPELAAQIESTLEEYLKQGALAKPSAMVIGKDETFQTLAHKEETEFRAFYRRQMEARGVDAKASEKVTTEREAYDYSNKNMFSAGNNTVDVTAEVDPFHRDVSENWIDSAVSAVEANLPCHTIFEDYDVDDDERSVVSGLTTLHSAMTREVLHDCEQSVAEFLREEQANIRKIMEEEPDEDYSHASGTIEVDLANKATAEAESMVQKMEEILNEYQAKHGNASVKGSASSVNGSVAQDHEPRPFPTDNPDEHWMVYYDEFYKQEYYHEKNSNRTQWEPPAVSVSSVGSSGASVMSHIEVMPELSSAKDMMMNTGAFESRVAKYRRKRRRARRRKLIATAVALGFAALAVLVAFQLSPEQRSIEGIQNLVETQYRHLFGGAAQQKKQEDLYKTVLMKKQQKSITKDDEHERKRMLKEQEKLRLAAEQALLLAEEAERLRAEEEERQKALLHRPWACNIPFSYIFHSRCRRLANQNPVFDLQALVNSMLQ